MASLTCPSHFTQEQFIEVLSYLEDFEILDCSYCPLITSIPHIEGLKILNCAYCPLIASIPHIRGLKELNCSYCPLITSIPHIEGLRELRCRKCPLITSIPSIEELRELNCSECPLISSIPYFECIDEIHCDNCRLIINFPYSSCMFLNWDNCPWISVGRNFNNNLQKLIECQKITKRIIKRKRFVKYIKSREFNEWFYAPNGIGGRIHKKNMLKSLQEINATNIY